MAAPKLISRRYEVLELLGQGGMGTVYKVRHTALGSISALKVLPPELMKEPEMVTRFYREARIMANLSHPSIVRVLDIDHDDVLDFHYFVMEYVEGQTLKRYVEKKGSLTLAETVDVVGQVARALAYAHAHTPPIIHRDIKPSNIMIEDRSGRVVVMDFGIAKELDGKELTRPGVTIGTLKYCAPEQMRQEPLDGAVDVYALGMVMYEAFTGKHLFAGLGERELVARVLVEKKENAPVFEKPTPQAFADLVARAIAKARDVRFPSMAAFLRELDTCLAESGATPTRSTGTTGRFRPRLVASRGDAPRLTELKPEWRDVAATKETPAGPAPQLAQQVQEVRDRTSLLRDATSSVKGRHRDRAERGWRRAERLLEEGNLAEAKTSFEEAATLFSALTSRIEDGVERAQLATAPAREIAADEGTVVGVAPDPEPAARIVPEQPVVPAVARAAEPAPDATLAAPSVLAAPGAEAAPVAAQAAPRARASRTPVIAAAAVALAGLGIYLAVGRGGDATTAARPPAVAPEASAPAGAAPGAQEATAPAAVAKVAGEPAARPATADGGAGGPAAAAATAGGGAGGAVKLAVVPPAPTAATASAMPEVAAAPAAPAAEPAAGAPAVAAAPAAAAAPARDAAPGTVAAIPPSTAGPASAPPPAARSDLGDAAQIVRFTRNPTVDIDADADADATVTLDDRPVKADRNGRFRGTLTGLPVGVSQHTLRITDAKGATEEIPVAVTYYPAWEMRRIDDLNGEAYAVAFTPDGTRVLAGTRNDVVKMWDVATGTLVRTFSGHKDWVNDIAVSPDGKLLVSGSKDRTLKIWDIATGAELRTLSGHKGWVNGVAFSPDGSKVASVSDDQTVRLWSVATGNLLATLEGHKDWTLAVAFSPDGKVLASGGRDKVVKLWDVATGEELRTLSGHTDWVNAVAFSPDGKLLASASDDRRIKLWDVATGQIVRTLTGHGGWVVGIAFSPDGTKLISSSKDQTVRLWDVATGEELRTFSGHQGLVSDVAFSPDGKSAVSGGRDRTLRVWWTASEPSRGRETEKGRGSG